jgi:hypothetical protein
MGDYGGHFKARFKVLIMIGLPTAFRVVAIAGLAAGLCACATSRAPGSAVAHASQPAAPASKTVERLALDLDAEGLTDRSVVSLLHQARWLRAHPRVRILIADTAPASETPSGDPDPGLRHAASVRQLLIHNGVEQRRIETRYLQSLAPLEKAQGLTLPFSLLKPRMLVIEVAG